jgi:hypothetical protein
MLKGQFFMTKVIYGTQKVKPDMELLWLTAFQNAVISGDYKKIIVAGVKYINTSRPTKDRTDAEQLQRRFYIIEYIEAWMTRLTPNKFMQLFPIKKKYDGEKWGRKDYFYTLEYIKTLDTDKPIGDGKKLMDFLWEYQNREINEFLVELLSTTDDLMHQQGKDGPIDKLIEDLDVTPYYMQKDEATGQEYLLDGNTGKTVPIKKNIPRYLKLVKQ